MAVVFIHGVAVREQDDPQYPVVERLTRGSEWPAVETALREYVAPALRPQAPEQVALLRVYWGDLGVPAAVADREAASDDDQPPLADTERPLAARSPEELGELVQRELFEALPPEHWPAVVRAVWATMRESAIRAQLAARAPRWQQGWLIRQVRDRMAREDPELGSLLTTLTAGLAARSRRNVRLAMGGVRRPASAFVPVFVGDILRYVDGRGMPGAPGQVIERVRAVLREAGEAGAPGEPLVVLTHSMGGQVLYDVLTCFGDDMPYVDLWCAAGGQLGLFAQLGVFLEGRYDDARPLPERVGYLWNAWSSSDVLSYPAQGQVPLARDSDFAYTGSLVSTHMAYLRDGAFYRTLAALVETQAAASRSA